MSLTVTGHTASDGLFAGPVQTIEQQVISREPTGNPAAEASDLQRAIASAKQELENLATKLSGDSAAILAFQIAMLEDEALTEACWPFISNGAPADGAWSLALDEQIKGYSDSEDPYFRARAADLTDLKNTVLRHLAGTVLQGFAPGSVLVGADLSPSQYLSHDWSQGGAIVLQGGSITSHVAMLARSHGRPMLVQVETPPTGTFAMVDGNAAQATFDPSPAELLHFTERMQKATSEAAADDLYLAKPATRRDGSQIKVFVNIASPEDTDNIAINTCDGVGLMRSEFLFRDGEPLPDEETQYRAYSKVLRWAEGKPVTIRTLDVGGDKPIEGLTPQGETNPFLGLRGVRLSLARPDVFRVQLRALARAAAHGHLLIMLPMVTVPGEITEARALLQDVVKELQAEGQPARMPPLGIMVEVPAVAIAPELFREAAFFSIGSNDLAQYVTAASRDGGAVAALNDPANPAVTKLIASVAAFGREHNLPVSLCGDMASDIAHLPTLLQAGLTSLSVAPARLARIKRAIAAI